MGVSQRGTAAPHTRNLENGWGPRAYGCDDNLKLKICQPYQGGVSPQLEWPTRNKARPSRWRVSNLGDSEVCVDVAAVPDETALAHAIQGRLWPPPPTAHQLKTDGGGGDDTESLEDS
jgi:hypothetical protein